MVARGRGGGKTPERVVASLQEEVRKTSQAATARATGLTLQTVQRYIKGIGEPSQATLEKLAEYFGVSVSWLRGEEIPKIVFETLRDKLQTGKITMEKLIRLFPVLAMPEILEALNDTKIREAVEEIKKIPKLKRWRAVAMLKELNGSLLAADEEARKQGHQ